MHTNENIISKTKEGRSLRYEVDDKINVRGESRNKVDEKGNKRKKSVSL